MPVHADGTPHAMTARAQRFAERSSRRFAIPVRLADERYTTQAAQRSWRARARRAARERDEVAAQLILQGWFDDGGG